MFTFLIREIVERNQQTRKYTKAPMHLYNGGKSRKTSFKADMAFCLLCTFVAKSFCLGVNYITLP